MGFAGNNELRKCLLPKDGDTDPNDAEWRVIEELERLASADSEWVGSNV